MIIDIIHKAKFNLIEKDVPKPYVIRLSTVAHDLLIAEMRKNGGLRYRSKDTKIFEILGMSVEIDSLCPPQGAYIVGGGEE